MVLLRLKEHQKLSEPTPKLIHQSMFIKVEYPITNGFDIHVGLLAINLYILETVFFFLNFNTKFTEIESTVLFAKT